MAVCFLHTADWQIGKQFGNIADEARVFLANQRIDTIKTIARIAGEHAADAILVAGDVFETHAVADLTIRRTLNAMAAFPGPWVLLPGNHDAALAESPWTRILRLGKPENVHLVTMPEPLPLLGGRLTILPAPLQRRHEAIDLTEWFDAAPSEPGAVRVGLAHGSVTGFLPEAAEAPNPIAHDRAQRARLDYLALGDWHGTLKINERTRYAGTPEPDRFKANDQGNVLIVRIEAPGAPPVVNSVRSARYRWHELSLAIHGESDIAGLREAFESLDPPIEQAVVNLTLQGAIDLRTRLAVNAALDEIKARVLHLGIDEDLLIAEPSEDDLDQIDQQGFVRAAIEQLRDRARDPANADRDVARLALQILYLEHQKLSAER